jgi:tetratricopeptide (TPR) repeat protein
MAYGSSPHMLLIKGQGSQLRRVLAAGAISTVVAGIVFGLGPTGGGPLPAVIEATKPRQIDTLSAIELFAGRLVENPRDAASAAVLGELRLRRFRETGDLGELEKAENVLTQAIGSLPQFPQASATLAQVDLALHRFDEALATARFAAEADPSIGAQVTAADALVALGQYQEAELFYLEAQSEFASPELSARLAHLKFINGDIDSALLTMRKAARVYLASGGSGEPAAWFLARVGDLEMASGEYRAAKASYRASLEVFPGYHLGLAGLGRALTALGELDEAIEAYEAALVVRPLPETLSAVGDLYLLTGRPDTAAERFATVDAIAALGGGVYNRAVALHYADHGRPEDALRLAESGIGVRPDVYGYDTLAWALYRVGRFGEALAAAERANSLGTADATFSYHLGAIRMALGDRPGASEALVHAIDLSPEFHPVGAAEAKRLLQEAGT